MKTVLFISGIDTDVGKTVATGLYARELAAAGHRVITQKLVQTGCSGIAGDILSHRRLQGIGPTAFDNDGTTAPYVFPYPCSPHLAAAQQGTSLNLPASAAPPKPCCSITIPYCWKAPAA